ncbi:MAG: DNA-processing protein DprA [Desulfatibacillaceae bacterium]
MEHLAPWFSLKSVPGVGNVLFRRLLERFGTSEAVLAAPLSELGEVEGVGPRVARAIVESGGRLSDTARRSLDRVAELGLSVVTLHDPGYPDLLRHIHDPPPYLYLAGALPKGAPHVAVVGSRTPTPYGIRQARRISAGLAEAGVVVVSGMAAGIDTEAHEGALEGGGPTVAVAGCGLANVYPGSNRRLFGEISQNGAVISEFPVDARPAAPNFPARNRIISGMCAATIVVEAAARSGSLITARLAGEQGRDVMAVPGSVSSDRSAGTNRLIKQGAALVESARDVLEQLSPTWSVEAGARSAGRDTPPPRVEMSPEEAMVRAELTPYPTHIDVLAQRLNMESGRIAGILLQLELKGVAVQMPGKYFTTA